MATNDATYQDPIQGGGSHIPKVGDKVETNMITEYAPVIATEGPAHQNKSLDTGTKVNHKVDAVASDGTPEDIGMSDMATEDAANDRDNESVPCNNFTFIDGDGKWRWKHSAIKRGHTNFKQAFPLGPDIFYQPFTCHGLGGFQAIIHSMAAQHPGLRVPKLTEFAFALKRCANVSLKTQHDQPYKTAFHVLSGSKVDGQGNWEPDCFNNDTRFLLQDHLALIFNIWQKARDVNITLAIWNNGVPWAYKIWERDGFKVNTDLVVWIYHDGLQSYAGLGPVGSRDNEMIKALTFKDEELHAYTKIVQGAGSFIAGDIMNMDAAQHSARAGASTSAETSNPAETATPAEQSAPGEHSVAAEMTTPAEEEPDPGEEESVPAEQTGPVQQSVSDMQLAPIEGKSVIVQQKPASAEDTGPAEQPAHVENMVSTDQSSPDARSDAAREELDPAEQLVPAGEESVPVQQASPVELPIPDLQSVTAEKKPTSAEDAPLAEQSAPVENTVTADQLPDEVQSAPAAGEPVIDNQPLTEEEMALVEQMILAKESVPAQQASPVGQPIPDTQSVTAQKEPISAGDAPLAEQPVRVENAVTADQSLREVQSTPADEDPHTIGQRIIDEPEMDLIEESGLAEESAPVEQSTTTEQSTGNGQPEL